MKGINTTIVTGNIGSFKTITNGEDVSTSISVAVDDSYKLKGQEEWTKRTTWIEVVVKGDRTDRLAVGQLIGAQGKVSVGAYINEAGQAVGVLKLNNAKLSYLEKAEKAVATETNE